MGAKVVAAAVVVMTFQVVDEGKVVVVESMLDLLRTDS